MRCTWTNWLCCKDLSLLLRLGDGRGNVSVEMSRKMRDLRKMWPLVGAGFVMALAGCGRPATRADCESILDKSAEIELKAQNVNDPAEVKRRMQAARDAQGETLLAKCVGRRITDKALACVREASTAEQVDRCLD